MSALFYKVGQISVYKHLDLDLDKTMKFSLRVHASTPCPKAQSNEKGSVYIKYKSPSIHN